MSQLFYLQMRMRVCICLGKKLDFFFFGIFSIIKKSSYNMITNDNGIDAACVFFLIIFFLNKRRHIFLSQINTNYYETIFFLRHQLYTRMIILSDNRQWFKMLENLTSTKPHKFLETLYVRSVRYVVMCKKV